MRFLALCCDYDGTIAHDGMVTATTTAALARLKESGRRLVLVTGREIPDLRRAYEQLELFDRIVVENGGVLFVPQSGEVRRLAAPPPRPFVEQLQKAGVAPLSVGEVVVATWEPNEHAVLEAIRLCGMELQITFNKGAVMVLPAGVNKASGLRAALADMGISLHNAVGIGDAENDHAFLSVCECSVAVANALPAVKSAADFTTHADHGAGVVELIDELMHDDLQARCGSLSRHQILLGETLDAGPVTLSPYSISTLVVGSSGGGKSTVAIGLIERLVARGYSFCVVDPEGDYDNLETAAVLGGPDHAPSVAECVQFLEKAESNCVINLLGIKPEQRPVFFPSLFDRLRDLRMRTGRPHWMVIDEVHHVLPAQREQADDALPERLQGVLAISVTPKSIAPGVLRRIDSLILVGDRPEARLNEFLEANGMALFSGPVPTAAEGEVLFWDRATPGSLAVVKLEPTRTERRRHLRKYAEGELPEDRSFYFRGREGKLNLRARNLIAFLDLADGVDDDTWTFHLRRKEISSWLHEGIKDHELAGRVEAIETDPQLDPRASRHAIRQIIESTYTIPAGAS